MAFLVCAVRVVGLAYVGVDGVGTEAVLFWCGAWCEGLGVVFGLGIVALLIAGLVLLDMLVTGFRTPTGE